jgi:hypothetical protein
MSYATIHDILDDAAELGALEQCSKIEDQWYVRPVDVECSDRDFSAGAADKRPGPRNAQLAAKQHKRR